MKLCLGCDFKILARTGYKSVDIHGKPDIECDVFDLSVIPNDSCEVIIASHILEHGYFEGALSYRVQQVINVLRMWKRKLIKDGKIYIAVPDFEYVVSAYFTSRENFWANEVDIIGPLLGGATNANDFHNMIFNIYLLKYVMEQAGFQNVCEMQPGSAEFLPDVNGASRDIRSINMVGENI